MTSCYMRAVVTQVRLLQLARYRLPLSAYEDGAAGHGNDLKSLTAKKGHSMKKDELTALGLTDEQADKVLAINGRDIEKHKKAAEDAKAETATLQQQLSDRDKDLETLKAGAEDAEKVKQQLTDLQTKYNDETAKYQKQIADRDYADALETAFNDGKIEFTSKGAKAAACADFMATRCELKDGKLVGFEARIEDMRKKDPDSFRAEKPDPSFANPTGNGSPTTLSRAAQAARAQARDSLLLLPPQRTPTLNKEDSIHVYSEN